MGGKTQDGVGEIIQMKIYENRGQKVMWDFDLAKLFEEETKKFSTKHYKGILTDSLQILCSRLQRMYFSL